MIPPRWSLTILILTVSSTAGWFAGPFLNPGPGDEKSPPLRIPAAAAPASPVTLPDASTGLGGYTGRQLNLLARTWRDRFTTSNPARSETELMERMMANLHSPADFAAFGRLLPELKDQNPLSSFFPAVFYEWSLVDPRAAAEAALLIDVNNETSRGWALESVYNTWAEKDCAAALAHAEQSASVEARQAGRRAALKVTARTDPAAGMTLALSSPAPAGSTSDPASTLLFEWFNRDSAKALAWVEAQQDPQLLQRALRIHAGYAYSSSSPEGALRTAMTFPPGQDQDHLIGHAMLLWSARVKEGKKDVESLVAAVQALPSPQRTAATEKLVYSLPPEAVGKLDNWEPLATSDAERDHFSRLTVTSLVRQDRFEDAVTKLNSLPETTLRSGDSAALRADLFSMWWLKSPQDATLWMRDLPFKNKEQAFVHASSTLLLRKAITHRGLAELSLKLNSPDAVRTAVSKWSASDAAAAAAWTEANVRK